MQTVHGDTTRPILLGYDGSGSAKHAIAQAGELFAPAAAVVLHVWLPLSHVLLWNPLIESPGPLAEPAEVLDEAGRDAAGRLAQEGAVLARRAGLDATPEIAETRRGVWRVLLRRADALDARLLVVGRNGMSGVSRMLGSVTSGVVQHARKPVVVIPDPGRR